MSWIMSREERESFLAETRVGILSIALEGRGPLASPIWYGFEPGGDVQFVTDRTSRKGKLLKEEGVRISLCVQDDAPPYRYVCVEGPVVRAESLDTEAIERELANRYLGPEGGGPVWNGHRCHSLDFL